MKSTDFSMVLNLFSNAITQLAPHDLDLLIEGAGVLKLSVAPVVPSQSKPADLDSNALQSIKKTLLECFDRTEAFTVLSEYKKGELECIAKAFDIPRDRNARREEMITIIVERSVGTRLRREAMRGVAA